MFSKTMSKFTIAFELWVSCADRNREREGVRRRIMIGLEIGQSDPESTSVSTISTSFLVTLIATKDQTGWKPFMAGGVGNGPLTSPGT